MRSFSELLTIVNSELLKMLENNNGPTWTARQATAAKKSLDAVDAVTSSIMRMLDEDEGARRTVIESDEYRALSATRREIESKVNHAAL